MDDEKGKILVEMAREALEEALEKGTIQKREEKWLKEKGATFVTLRKNGELRGCIGTVEAYRPLEIDVRENAVASGLRDPRFPILEADELSEIKIEVSYLSPMEPISFSSEGDALSKLNPHTDGVVFEYRSHRSTFLPQVWGSMPNRKEFIGRLKEKAGLSATFWDEEIQLWRYTCQKWSEDNHG